MLNEEQQAAAVTLTGAQVVVALQIVNRLITTGGLKDVELSPVGSARDGMVAALQQATGVNFDEAKAQQEAVQRQRIAQALPEGGGSFNYFTPLCGSMLAVVIFSGPLATPPISNLNDHGRSSGRRGYAEVGQAEA